MPATLMFTKKDVIRHLDALVLLDLLRKAFVENAGVSAGLPVRIKAPVPNGAAFAVLPGCLASLPSYSVRIDTRGDGTAPPKSLIQLHAAQSGELLAVMDATHLVALQAAVVGALATDVLARKDASRIALLGAGKEATLHLKILRLVRSLSHVRLYDPDSDRAEIQRFSLYDALRLPIRTAASVEEAVADADIVVTSSEAPEPFLDAKHVPPGVHVTVNGAEAGRHPAVTEELARTGVFVTSARALSALRGAPVGVELGEVLSGRAPARRAREDVTLFENAGPPFQDLVAANLVYELGSDDPEVTRVELSG